MPASRFRQYVASLLSLVLPLAAARADYIEVGSPSGSGNLTVSLASPLSYNLGVTTAGGSQSLLVSNIQLTIDRGSQTTAPIIIDMYNSFGAASGTGTIIASTTIPFGNISQASFGTVSSTFSTPVSLPASGYSVRVSTTSPGTSSDKYQIKTGAMSLYTTGSTLVPTYYWVQDQNSTGSAGTSLVASGTVLAQYTLGTNAFRFGNYRVGTSPSGTTAIVNTALVTSNTVTQALAVTATTSGGLASLTGLPSPYLPVGSTSQVVAGLNGATTGPNSGTATLSFRSVPGTSLTTGSTAVGNGTVTVTGTGYDWANALYTGTTFAFGYIHRGGAAGSGTAAIGNQKVFDATYQDSLDASATTGNPFVAATGFSGLAASTGGSTTNNLVVSIGTGTAGSLASTLALSLVSNANGVAGLSNGTATVVGSPGSITTTGTVFTGQSTWNTNGGGQWGTLASGFGTNWNWGTFDGSPGVDPGFTNTDTATFGSALTSGSATVSVTAATPSVKLVTFNNAAATYSVAGASGGSLALLNTGTTPAKVAVMNGSHAMSLPVSLGSNTDFDVAPGSILSMSGVISGAKAVASIGSGTTIFSGNNSYLGVTTVSAGRLLIHGNQSAATGAVTVAGGATLGGRGTAGGAVTVLANGILSPGASVESLAVGATTFSSGSSTFAYEVDSSVLVGSGSAADLLVSNGNLSIGGGSILEFTDLASSPAAFAQGTKFSLISYGSNAWNGGLFTYQGNELANFERFSAGLNQWEIRYDDPAGGSNYTADQLAGNSVTITVVPEPASLALAGLGIAAAALAFVRSRCR